MHRPGGSGHEPTPRRHGQRPYGGGRVLTPEQEKQVEAMGEEWRREWKEAHRGRHHRGGHGEHDDQDSKDG